MIKYIIALKAGRLRHYTVMDLLKRVIKIYFCKGLTRAFKNVILNCKEDKTKQKGAVKW